MARLTSVRCVGAAGMLVTLGSAAVAQYTFYGLTDRGTVIRFDQSGSHEIVASLDWSGTIDDFWTGITSHPDGRIYALNFGGTIYRLDTITSPPVAIGQIARPVGFTRFNDAITVDTDGHLVVSAHDLSNSSGVDSRAWIGVFDRAIGEIIAETTYAFRIWQDFAIDATAGTILSAKFGDDCVAVFDPTTGNEACTVVQGFGRVRGVELLSGELAVLTGLQSGGGAELRRVDPETFAVLSTRTYGIPYLGAGTSLMALPTLSISICRADLAAPTGFLNIDDVLTFLQAFAVQNPAADLDRDGDYDTDDALFLINAFANGGC